MKTIISFLKKKNNAWLYISIALLAGILFLITPSCQKNVSDFSNQESLLDPDLILTPEMCRSFQNVESSNVYWEHKIFKRGYGAPFIETYIIENPNFGCYDGNFILKIQNGRDKRTRVSSAEIFIDGVLVAGPSDFSKNKYSIIKTLSGLTAGSILQVKLNGTPGSFIDIWIEGKTTIVTPVFEQIGPLCQNDVVPELPLSSSNTPSITGTWNPATINTAITGKTSYTFTPAEGQCASSITMDIQVAPSITPTFTQIGPLLQNSLAPELPLVSNNGISGKWIPATISTLSAGTNTFIFTPSAGQCATTAEITIEVTASNTGVVSDVEGNLYKTIKLGDQWWMAENLKTIKYRNGDLIGTTIPASKNISGELAPKYQWAFDGNENNVATYGRLYTLYALTDNRGVCPVGWHLPSDEDWTTLTDFLTNNGYGYGGSGNDIGKSLAATSGWLTDVTAGNVGNDQVSNNSSGFTALPAGFRVYNGTFVLIGSYASWWSSSDVNSTQAWVRFIKNNLNFVTRTESVKEQGGAVRCVKD